MSRFLILFAIVAGVVGLAELAKRRFRRRAAEARSHERIATDGSTTLVVSVSPATARQLHLDHPEFSRRGIRPRDEDAAATGPRSPVAADDLPEVTS